MNDAVYKFKRYEDATLVYMGINKHEGQDIGLYDTGTHTHFTDIFNPIRAAVWPLSYYRSTAITDTIGDFAKITLKGLVFFLYII
jgi:hypothetical protein